MSAECALSYRPVFCTLSNDRFASPVNPMLTTKQKLTKRKAKKKDEAPVHTCDYDSEDTERLQKLLAEYRAISKKFYGSKKKHSSREILSMACWQTAIGRLERVKMDAYYLVNTDPVVATRALSVFRNPEASAIWLTTPLKQLWNKTPRECRKEDVLQVLGRMENGVFA